MMPIARRQSARLRKMQSVEPESEETHGSEKPSLPVVEPQPEPKVEQHVEPKQTAETENEEKINEPAPAPTPRRRKSRVGAKRKSEAPKQVEQNTQIEFTADESNVIEPEAPKMSPTKEQTSDETKSKFTTPQRSEPFTPSSEAMHPSRHHHSTVKKPDDGIVLGFYPIEDNTKVPRPSSVASALAAAQRTPTRCHQPEDSSFNFTFGDNLSPNLKPDQRRLMDEIRAKSAISQGAGRGDNQVVLADSALQASRSIARRPKEGRYSAAHQAQFSKMDSIANHPSVLRRTPGGTRGRPPVVLEPPQAVSPVKRPLKRTQSKADLGIEQPPMTATQIEKSAPSDLKSKRQRPNFGTAPTSITSALPVPSPSKSRSKLPQPATVTTSPTKSAIPRFSTAVSSFMGPAKSFLSRMTPLASRPARSSVTSPTKEQQTETKTAVSKSIATVSAAKPTATPNRAPTKSFVVNVREPSAEPQTPTVDRKETEIRPKSISFTSPSPLKPPGSLAKLVSLSPSRAGSKLKPPQPHALKSILRSPSKDALQPDGLDGKKVTAISPTLGKQRRTLLAKKKVDFSASTMERAELQEFENAPAPTIVSTPRPKASDLPPVEESPSMDVDSESGPQSSPSTNGFTFRYGNSRMSFNRPQPNPLTSMPIRFAKPPPAKPDFLSASTDLPKSTGKDDVFYPSLSPIIGSKRKVSSMDAPERSEADKENVASTSHEEEDGRPAKRSRRIEPTTPRSQIRSGYGRASIAPRTAPVDRTRADRRRTVAPPCPSSTKPVRTGAGMSMERLNFLATPKNRG